MSTRTAGDAAVNDPTDPAVAPVATPRRRILTHLASAVLGAGMATGAKLVRDDLTQHYPLPFYGGYAAAIHASRTTPPKSNRVDVVWGVDTAKKLVALTFDDGPKPNWTPDVLSLPPEEDLCVSLTPTRRGASCGLRCGVAGAGGCGRYRPA
jgi:hypothetical protein